MNINSCFFVIYLALLLTDLLQKNQACYWRYIPTIQKKEVTYFEPSGAWITDNACMVVYKLRQEYVQRNEILVLKISLHICWSSIRWLPILLKSFSVAVIFLGGNRIISFYKHCGSFSEWSNL